MEKYILEKLRRELDDKFLEFTDILDIHGLIILAKILKKELR